MSHSSDSTEPNTPKAGGEDAIELDEGEVFFWLRPLNEVAGQACDAFTRLCPAHWSMAEVDARVYQEQRDQAHERRGALKMSQSKLGGKKKGRLAKDEVSGLQERDFNRAFETEERVDQEPDGDGDGGSHGEDLQDERNQPGDDNNWLFINDPSTPPASRVAASHVPAPNPYTPLSSSFQSAIDNLRMQALQEKTNLQQTPA
ncbi:MAG: hypothetical protein Q9210_004091 [Variospora velana]